MIQMTKWSKWPNDPNDQMSQMIQMIQMTKFDQICDQIISSVTHPKESSKLGVYRYRPRWKNH